MHETLGIITNVIGQARAAFLEIAFLSLLNVVPFDFNILVSIRSTLHVEQSQSMHEFMHNGSKIHFMSYFKGT